MPNAHPDLWQRYQATKAASTAKYARDIAAEMGISEAELTAARLGHDAVRLSDDARTLIAALERVGETKCICRNEYAVHEQVGQFTHQHLSGHAGLVLPFSAAGLIALYMPMLAAFIGSLAVMVVIFILSRAEEGSLSRLLLVGIAINALCGALVGVLSWLSNDAQLRQLSLWGMGSLGQAEWPTLLVAATLIIPAALAVWWMASRLNLLQLGDEEAHYLGVNVQALQRWLLLCSAVLVAVAVAISGVIGFIGLVVPHLMRLWLGPDHRGLIPGSLLAGAILLLLADTLARTVAAPAEIPVGLLTSLLGAPWFLWLVFRRENSRHG
ncbi:iron chelate uptake ABC transporter family permease subunit [Klebsiella pneumoniae]|nr:iron chelate uptake ABC transporter family permease subunit [Klebsiella pneumoniae]